VAFNYYLVHARPIKKPLISDFIKDKRHAYIYRQRREIVKLLILKNTPRETAHIAHDIETSFLATL